MSHTPKKFYDFRRFLWMGLAIVLTFSSCLGLRMLINRGNLSASTIQAEELATAAARIASPTPPAWAQFVQLSLFPHLEGNMLVVEGVTDLPNRTLLMYEVTQVSPESQVVNGTMPVLDGRYARKINLTGWHAGTIAVWVGFQTRVDNSEEQPEEIIERFGEMGEFLYGENVTEAGGLKRVQVMKRVEYSP